MIEIWFTPGGMYKAVSREELPAVLEAGRMVRLAAENGGPIEVQTWRGAVWEPGVPTPYHVSVRGVGEVVDFVTPAEAADFALSLLE
jgi:hypothetical protein